MAKPFLNGIIAGALKLTGGSPGAGKVLISDADGDASWSDELVNKATRWAPLGTHVSGNYGGCNSLRSSTTAAGTLNELRVYPWYVPHSLPLAGLYSQFTVAGHADSRLRVGLYNDDGTGMPSSIIQELGSISTGTGNAGTVATGGTPSLYLVPVASAITLSPGLYWVGGVAQGTSAATFPVLSSFDLLIPLQITASAMSFTEAVGWRQASVSGALPSTFVATGLTSTPYRMGFRVA